MYRVGRTTGYRLQMDDETFALLRASGMTLIEHSFSRPDCITIEEVASLAERHGLKIWSCHLPHVPFDMMDVSSPDKEVRKTAISRYSELIKRAAVFGVDKFVMHPGTPFEDESERPLRLECAKESANEIAEVAWSEGARIAVEDMPHCIGRSIDELSAIISANDKLRICFDVNHLLNNTHEEFIDILGDKIITVHFSDYDFVEERHMFPTTGKIDWVPLIKKLYGAGYTGPWIYECGLGKRTFDDFYSTAVNILKAAGIESN